MQLKTIKPKYCAYKPCGKEFVQFKTTDRWCCRQHYLLWVAQKEIDDKVEKLKVNLRNYSYYIKLAQAVFNTFIRLRDKGKPCICCGKPLGEKYHAGHFFTTGAFPGLRLDEDNCHGQREDCNLHKHGNSAEYALMLPKRIGEERFQALYNRRKNTSNPSIPELQDKIAYYKAKIKNNDFT